VIFQQNKYTRWYFRIIEKAKLRDLNGYFEKHHVIPKSLGGKNSVGNLVSLTAREHFVCHLLLVKAVYPAFKKKMNYAYWRMCNGNENRYKPNSRFYELGKQLFVESQLGHKPYNISQSVESRNLISGGMKKTLSTLSAKEMKDRMLNSCCALDTYTEKRAAKISKTRTGTKDSMSAKKNKSIAANKRDNGHLLTNAAKNKGRTWQLVDGKRAWMDKEILV